jgi:hypothetical protein
MPAGGPPIERGYRGIRRIATLEDFYGHAEQKNRNKDRNEQRGTKNGRTTHVATNTRTNVNTKMYERNPEESSNNNVYRNHRHKSLTAKERHARCGS